MHSARKLRGPKSIALVAFAAFGLLACSSSSNLGTGTGVGTGLDGGTSSSLPAKAAVSSSLGAGTIAGENDATKCSIPSGATWVDIGSDTASVSNGGTDPVSGKVAQVDCSVTANGATFTVHAHAGLGTQSITVTGDFPSNDASGSQSISAVTVGFQTSNTSYQDDNCVASYADQSSMGVAAGRVWTSILCANVPHGSDTCAGSAEIKFENCTQ